MSTRTGEGISSEPSQQSGDRKEKEPIKGESYNVDNTENKVQQEVGSTVQMQSTNRAAHHPTPFIPQIPSFTFQRGITTLECPSFRHQYLTLPSFLRVHVEVPGSSLPSGQSQKSSFILSTGTLRMPSKQTKTSVELVVVCSEG